MRASAFPPSPATVGAGASDETGPSAPERVALLRGEEEEELAGASAPADPNLRLDARADAADPETPKRRAGKPLLYREATDFMGRTRRYYSAAEVARTSSRTISLLWPSRSAVMRRRSRPGSPTCPRKISSR